MVSSFWNQRNVFITGCTGFVGRHLVNECCRLGANVTGLSRTFSKVEGINLVYGSLDDVQVLQKALVDFQIDTVFHLAAQADEGFAKSNPMATFETNIRGTWNLLEACRRTSVKRVIVASSEKAYGDSSPPPYVETLPVQGRLPYDVSKSCADLITNTYYHAYGLPVCIIRCEIIFGGGDLNFNRLIPHTIQSILENKAPVIRSDGTNIRDFIYIEDAVKAHLLVAEKLESCRLAGEAFNFSNETPKTIMEVVDQIISLTNSDLEPIIQNKVSDKNKQQFLSAKKARELLEWQTIYDFESGLVKTIDWYREYFKRR